MGIELEQPGIMEGKAWALRLLEENLEEEKDPSHADFPTNNQFHDVDEFHDFGVFVFSL